MNKDYFSELVDRINRLRTKLATNSGQDFNYAAEVEGVSHSYMIKEIKNPVDRQDEIISLMVWVWSMRDYIKKKMIAIGYSEKEAIREVEAVVQDTLELQICADIANSEKHSGLDRSSRSGLNPYIAETGFSAPMESLTKIVQDEVGFVLDFARPEHVRYHTKIRSSEGELLGDAADIMSTALSKWEAFLSSRRIW